jgi:hypothetical protein
MKGSTKIIEDMEKVLTLDLMEELKRSAIISEKPFLWRRSPQSELFSNFFL